MRISDWSSDVCSSDLGRATLVTLRQAPAAVGDGAVGMRDHPLRHPRPPSRGSRASDGTVAREACTGWRVENELLITPQQAHQAALDGDPRSEEHKAEIPSLKRNTNAVSCVKKKQENTQKN